MLLDELASDVPGLFDDPDFKTQREPERAGSRGAEFKGFSTALQKGTPYERGKANFEAVRTLHAVEAAGRPATEDEQRAMARYVGWGGLAEVLDDREDMGYRELNEDAHRVLYDDELEQARESALTAFYTPDEVTRAMWAALADAGFEDGDVLDAGSGTGIFELTAPGSVRRENFTCVEADSVSARIAQLLEPDAQVRHESFERTPVMEDRFDAVVGNVPFGQVEAEDNRFRRVANLHGYFIRKSLEMLRPGGVMAVIASRWFLDSGRDEGLRRDIARIADLAGAVRLPAGTFSETAGTEAVSDVLVFKKRADALSGDVPSWTRSEPFAPQSEDAGTRDVLVSSWYKEHPEDVLGDMSVESGRFGPELAVTGSGEGIGDRLRAALAAFGLEYEPAPGTRRVEAVEPPQGLTVRDWGLAVVDGAAYQARGGLLYPVVLSRGRALSAKQTETVRDAIALSRAASAQLSLESSGADDGIVEASRAVLRARWERFASDHGAVGSKANKRLLGKSSLYPLVSQLETVDEDGSVEPARILSSRAIAPAEPVEHTEDAREALELSMSVRGRIDTAYIEQLTGRKWGDVAHELGDQVFLDPATRSWQTADEYLSGHIREKIERARAAGGDPGAWARNIAALTAALPARVEAKDITAPLGAPWIDAETVQRFADETFHTWTTAYGMPEVEYSRTTATWTVTNQRADRSSYTDSVYGTEQKNAWELLANILNGKKARVMRTVSVNAGGEWVQKSVLDQRATAAARAKQKAIEAAWETWWRGNPKVSANLEERYNRIFNDTVPRTFDGSGLKFMAGMSPDVELRPHQKDAVARMMFGGNTLLAHCVGAGKTYEMVAAAQEGKRLGLHRKAMFVVPNHLTEQWGAEYTRLYPAAKVLVATKDDFSKANREAMFVKIATGDWDAVIIGHSQLALIPLSQERQARYAEEDAQRIYDEYQEAYRQRNGRDPGVKRLAAAAKRARAKAEKLKQKTEQGSVDFEQLGIDKLFVDESHYFKNLGVETSMGRNVAGVSTTTSQRSEDLFAKCRYMDEKTGGRGIVFATGTPISNSMVEMYTLQRYLQRDELDRLGIGPFDAWARTFGETVENVEINPTGTGFRTKTRFSRFNNLPELLHVFTSFADVKTADMLDLPVPEASYENIVCEPSPEQEAYVQRLAERADAVHERRVRPEDDNMLVITNDGRKVALDQRLIDPALPDYEGGKVNVCANKVAEIWRAGAQDRTTQLVFCDTSTPAAHGKREDMTEADVLAANDAFSVYDELKRKLVALGVPEREVAFVHDAKTEVQREALFGSVRKGEVRVLIGSTQKMGAGTNMQDRLIAIHNLDCPWRPADLEQRAGRIVRQGNMNGSVQVFRYVTRGTFDSYLYQMVEAKQRFISQVVTSRTPERTAREEDEAVMDYAAVKAAAVGDGRVQEKLRLDREIAQLKIDKQAHLSQTASAARSLEAAKQQLAALRADLPRYEADARAAQRAVALGESALLDMGDARFDLSVEEQAREAGKRLARAAVAAEGPSPVWKGRIAGFKVGVARPRPDDPPMIVLAGSTSTDFRAYAEARGLLNARKLAEAVDEAPERLVLAHEKIARKTKDVSALERNAPGPWPGEAELQRKEARSAELAAELGEDAPGAAEAEDELVDETDLGPYVDLSGYTSHEKGIINRCREEGRPLEPYLHLQQENGWRLETFAGAVAEALAAGLDPEKVLGNVQLYDVEAFCDAVSAGCPEEDAFSIVREVQRRMQADGRWLGPTRALRALTTALKWFEAHRPGTGPEVVYRFKHALEDADGETLKELLEIATQLGWGAMHDIDIEPGDLVPAAQVVAERSEYDFLNLCKEHPATDLVMAAHNPEHPLHADAQKFVRYEISDRKVENDKRRAEREARREAAKDRAGFGNGRWSPSWEGR